MNARTGGVVLIAGGALTLGALELLSASSPSGPRYRFWRLQGRGVWDTWLPLGAVVTGAYLVTR